MNRIELISKAELKSRYALKRGIDVSFTHHQRPAGPPAFAIDTLTRQRIRHAARTFACNWMKENYGGELRPVRRELGLARARLVAKADMKNRADAQRRHQGAKHNEKAPQ